MMIVSIQRKGSLMVLTFEDGGTLSLPRVVLREHPLREGQIFDDDSYFQSVEKTMNKKALERAVWWLSKKDHSEQQLIKKLTDSAFTRSSAMQACEFLKAGNYLNDARLSENLVRQKMKSNSPRKIAMVLRQKGITEETARQALDTLSLEDELDTATRLACKYLGKKQLEPTEARRKCSAYLARRGFGWDVIKAAYLAASGDQDQLE